jgi:hypothetical protein
VLVAALVAAALVAVQSVPTSTAQSDDCERALLAAPIEFAALPAGFRWTGIQLAFLGSLWNAGIEGDSQSDSASLFMTCVEDAPLFMQRLASVTETLGLDTEIEVVPIGDESYAIESPSRSVTELTWRHGGVIGRLLGVREAGPPIGDLEDIAMAIDAVLP